MPPVVRARGVGGVVTFRVSDPRARRGRLGDALLAHAHAHARGYMQSDYTAYTPTPDDSTSRMAPPDLRSGGIRRGWGHERTQHARRRHDTTTL